MSLSETRRPVTPFNESRAAEKTKLKVLHLDPPNWPRVLLPNSGWNGKIEGILCLASIGALRKFQKGDKMLLGKVLSLPSFPIFWYAVGERRPFELEEELFVLDSRVQVLWIGVEGKREWWLAAILPSSSRGPGSHQFWESPVTWETKRHDPQGRTVSGACLVLFSSVVVLGQEEGLKLEKTLVGPICNWIIQQIVMK